MSRVTRPEVKAAADKSVKELTEHLSNLMHPKVKTAIEEISQLLFERTFIEGEIHGMNQTREALLYPEKSLQKVEEQISKAQAMRFNDA